MHAPDRWSRPTGLVEKAIIAAHAVVLLGLAAVPVFAIADAACELIAQPAAHANALAQLGRWLVLLRNSVVVAGVATAVATGGGVLLGFLIARTDLPGRLLIVAAAVLGACVPTYVSAVFVFSVFPVWQFAESTVFCGLVYGLAYTPLATLILAAAFRSTERELEEQALLDVGPWRVLWRVTLPLAGWGIATVALIVILIVATDITISDLLLVRTFAEEVYTQYAQRRASAGPVLAALPVLVAIALLLVVFQRRFPILGEQPSPQLGRNARQLMLRRARWPLALACLLIIAALGVPPAIGLTTRIGSLAHFVAALGRGGLTSDLNYSARCAAAAATVAVLSGVGLAWAVRRTRLPGRVVLVVVVLLLALPAPVVGISLIEIFNRPGMLGRVYDSPAIVVLAYLTRAVPLGILLLLPAVRRVPLELELAARVDGCGWLGSQRHVYWPVVGLNALVVWLVLVILCFGEIGATVLVAPPGVMPASVRAFTLLHSGVYRDLAVLAVAAIAYIVLPWIALLAILHRRTRAEVLR